MDCSEEARTWSSVSSWQWTGTPRSWPAALPYSSLPSLHQTKPQAKPVKMGSIDECWKFWDHLAIDIVEFYVSSWFCMNFEFPSLENRRRLNQVNEGHQCSRQLSRQNYFYIDGCFSEFQKHFRWIFPDHHRALHVFEAVLVLPPVLQKIVSKKEPCFRY